MAADELGRKQRLEEPRWFTPSENTDKHPNFRPQNFGSVFQLKGEGELFHIIDVLK